MESGGNPDSAPSLFDEFVQTPINDGTAPVTNQPMLAAPIRPNTRNVAVTQSSVNRPMQTPLMRTNLVNVPLTPRRVINDAVGQSSINRPRLTPQKRPYYQNEAVTPQRFTNYAFTQPNFNQPVESPYMRANSPYVAAAPQRCFAPLLNRPVHPPISRALQNVEALLDQPVNQAVFGQPDMNYQLQNYMNNMNNLVQPVINEPVQSVFNVPLQPPAQPLLDAIRQIIREELNRAQSGSRNVPSASQNVMLQPTEATRVVVRQEVDNALIQFRHHIKEDIATHLGEIEMRLAEKGLKELAKK